MYYSNFCDNCKKLISIMSKQLERRTVTNIHFINIDKRVQNNGNLYAILDNGQQFHIPKAIQKVPALVVINEGNNILFGNAIYQYYGLNLMLNNPQSREQVETAHDPQPFTFEGVSGSSIGITSDKYSFVDISNEDMLAAGDGGINQLHTYITLNDYENGALRIEAPEDDGNDSSPNISLNDLREQREKDILMAKPSADQMVLPSYG